MKMGVREFRERISEVVNGDEPVIVTKNGEVVGRYTPLRPKKPAENIDMDAWMRRIEAFQTDLKARTPDWRERLASIGLDENGELIDECV